MKNNSTVNSSKRSLVRRTARSAQIVVKYLVRTAKNLLQRHPRSKSMIIALLNHSPWIKKRLNAFLPISRSVMVPVVLSERAQEIYRDIKIAMLRSRDENSN
jgi:hypothetical protein